MNEFLANPHVINVLKSIGLAIAVFLLAKLAIRIATKSGKRTTETPFVIKYTAIAFFGMALVFVWLDGLAPILTALTIVAAALTIVSKELLLNFLGSFVIFWRELFAIGDRIQVNDNSGDVISKGLFYFTLLETGGTGSTGHSTGRLIKIPNSLALTTPIINATRGAGYIWSEFDIVIDKSSDWEKAKEHLIASVGLYYEKERINLSRIKEIFEQRGIFFNKLEPRTYVDVADGGVRITLRYLCRARLARDSHDFVVTRLLKEKESLGIILADQQS